MAYHRIEAHQTRYNWFSDRVGKTLFRIKGSCKCDVCAESYENGVFVLDKDHASYLHDCENELGLIYFDTKEERDEYEK